MNLELHWNLGKSRFSDRNEAIGCENNYLIVEVLLTEVRL